MTKKNKAIIISWLLICISIGHGFDKDSILIRAGLNSQEVEKFIIPSEKNGYKDWAEFLLSAMPDVDLVNFKADDFINYFEALNKNFSRVPWRNKINDNLFYYYILPYRVSQEPLENFTTIYADTLYNLIKDTKNMRDAVFRINEWVYTKMKYEPTEQWDQNAITTIKRGIGRCEEMSILFIKALRTVCIPARHTYTPWWPFTNSNHAWVEIWTGDGWHSLGGGELTDLDNAWFRVPTKRAAIIKSIVYGEMPEGEEIIDKKDKKYTVINSTANYTDVVNLNIQVTKNNIPIESASVSINVYNYASLVPVGSKKTDNNGYVNWVVGKTDLFIYAYKDSLLAYQIWRPSEKGDETIIIDISKREIPDTSFWLYTRKVPSQSIKSKYQPDIDQLKKLQDQHLQAINLNDLPFSTGIPDIDSSLTIIFSNAKGNARPLLQFYFDLPDSLRTIFTYYFKALVSKDIVELDTIGLRQELTAVIQSIKAVSKNTPDSIMKAYVIPSRILYERIGKWRDYILKIACEKLPVLKFSNINITRDIDNLFSWMKNNIAKKKDRDIFGPMMNPEDVYKAKRATDTEQYVFIVGVLRSIGIPARIKWSFDAVEYWDNGWKEKSFEPLVVGARFEREDNSQPKGCGYLKLKFEENNQDVTSKKVYYEDFSITQFKDTPIRLEPEIDTINNNIIVSLKTEPAHLITGWRNGFGDTYVRLKKIIPTLDTNEYNLKTDIPEDIKPGDLIVREYHSFSGLDKLGIKKKEIETDNVLIIIFDTQSEASKSTLKNAWEDINIFKGKVYLLANAQDKEQAQVFLKERDIYKGNLFLIKEDIYKNWGVKDLPSVLLLKDGKCIFWTEGLNLHLSRLIQTFQ